MWEIYNPVLAKLGFVYNSTYHTTSNWLIGVISQELTDSSQVSTNFRGSRLRIDPRVCSTAIAKIFFCVACEVWCPDVAVPSKSIVPAEAHGLIGQQVSNVPAGDLVEVETCWNIKNAG